MAQANQWGRGAHITYRWDAFGQTLHSGDFGGPDTLAILARAGQTMPLSHSKYEYRPDNSALPQIPSRILCKLLPSSMQDEHH